MAQIIKKKNDLVIKRNIIMAVHYGGMAIFILSSILCIETLFSNLPKIVPLIIALLGLAGLFTNDVTKKQLGIYSAGISGESSATKTIANALPDNYRCITNLQVYHDGKHSELDLVIIGDAGIFIVEIKNQKGTIFGRYDDQNLQHKKRKETKTLYNPIKQVSTHTDRLARFLRDNQINVWVNGMVFFNNPDAIVNIKDIPTSGDPVFIGSAHNMELFIKHITSHRGQTLSREKQDQIIKLLT